jgi:aerobic carbon-monoxide dehydrogenase small subunit
MKTEITLTLNGSQVSVMVGAEERLIDMLRGPLGLTGTKEGCGEGECGACTVIVNGRTVNACLFPALEAEGCELITIEGLLGPCNQLSPLQQAFVDRGAIQCGFCSPGMILSARALLDENPDPSEPEIREALLGNLCRCTGYAQIVEAVREAGARLRRQRQEGGLHG